MKSLISKIGSVISACFCLVFGEQLGAAEMPEGAGCSNEQAIRLVKSYDIVFRRLWVTHQDKVEVLPADVDRFIAGVRVLGDKPDFSTIQELSKALSGAGKPDVIRWERKRLVVSGASMRQDLYPRLPDESKDPLWVTTFHEGATTWLMPKSRIVHVSPGQEPYIFERFEQMLDDFPSVTPSSRQLTSDGRLVSYEYEPKTPAPGRTRIWLDPALGYLMVGLRSEVTEIDGNLHAIRRFGTGFVPHTVAPGAELLLPTFHIHYDQIPGRQFNLDVYLIESARLNQPVPPDLFQVAVPKGFDAYLLTASGELPPGSRLKLDKPVADARELLPRLLESDRRLGEKTQLVAARSDPPAAKPRFWAWYLLLSLPVLVLAAALLLFRRRPVPPASS